MPWVASRAYRDWSLQVVGEDEQPDVVRQVGRRPGPRLVVDVAEAVDDDDGGAGRDAEGIRHLIVGRSDLLPPDVAVHVSAAGCDLFVETGQGVDEALGRLLVGDERALALDPFDDPLVLELREGLPNHRAGDAELLAEPVLAGQQVAGAQAEAGDVVDDPVLELVVHRHGGLPVDVGGGAAVDVEFWIGREGHGGSILLGC